MRETGARREFAGDFHQITTNSCRARGAGIGFREKGGISEVIGSPHALAAHQQRAKNCPAALHGFGAGWCGNTASTEAAPLYHALCDGERRISLSEANNHGNSNRPAAAPALAETQTTAAARLRMNEGELEYSAAAHPHQMCVDEELSARADQAVLERDHPDRQAPSSELNRQNLER